MCSETSKKHSLESIGHFHSWAYKLGNNGGEGTKRRKQTMPSCVFSGPNEQLLQGLVEDHHARPVGQGGLGGGGGERRRLGGRRVAQDLPLGPGRGLFVLHTVGEAQLQDLLPEIVHNLGGEGRRRRNGLQKKHINWKLTRGLLGWWRDRKSVV